MAGQDVKDLAKIDPEFEAFLKTLPAVPRLQGDIATLRKQLSDAKRKLTESVGAAGPPEDVKEEDITVAARDGYAIPVRTYKPKSPPADGSPLVVLYHGGGFCLGDLQNEELNCRNFVRELGAVCVNVDYRLAPENKFPAAINDSWDVLQWAAKNASTLGADPSKGFIIYGTSAGSGITVVLSHLARDNALSPPLTGVGLSIPIVFDTRNPPAEFKPHLIAYEQNADAPILGAEIMNRFLAEYGYDPTSKLYTPFAGPKEEWNFKNLPPTAFWVCGMDPLRDDGIVYERVLRENGVETKMHMYPGLPHSFWSFAPSLDVSKKIVQDFIEGVGWLLAQK